LPVPVPMAPATTPWRLPQCVSRLTLVLSLRPISMSVMGAASIGGHTIVANAS
jgi:hypothetical protein